MPEHTPVAQRDLRAYRKIAAPKFKKDYADKLLRVPVLPPERRLNHALGRYEDGPESIVPGGAIMRLHSRDVLGKDHPVTLRCRWLCPTCAHEHERTLPEAWLAEGKAEFVEECGPAQDTPNIIYLASPYSHPDPAVRQARWLESGRAAAYLMSGVCRRVIAPICMGHPVSVIGGESLPHDFAGWKDVCLALLGAATDIAVLQIDGWETSVGIAAEVAHARKLGLPIWTLRDLAPPSGQYIIEENPNLFSGRDAS